MIAADKVDRPGKAELTRIEVREVAEDAIPGWGGHRLEVGFVTVRFKIAYLKNKRNPFAGLRLPFGYQADHFVVMAVNVPHRRKDCFLGFMHLEWT